MFALLVSPSLALFRIHSLCLTCPHMSPKKLNPTEGLKAILSADSHLGLIKGKDQKELGGGKEREFRFLSYSFLMHIFGCVNILCPQLLSNSLSSMNPLTLPTPL